MKTKTKLIVWSIIWLITYCFLKTPCLTDENKALLNIINSYTFAYITIELIIEPIYKKNNKILYISVCILDLITFIFLSFSILCFAILQNSSDKSIPMALCPKLRAATRVEPIPLNGSIIIELFFENVLINFSHKETGYEAGCFISFSSLVFVRFLHILKEF